MSDLEVAPRGAPLGPQAGDPSTQGNQGKFYAHMDILIENSMTLIGFDEDEISYGRELGKNLHRQLPSSILCEDSVTAGNFAAVTVYAIGRLFESSQQPTAREIANTVFSNVLNADIASMYAIFNVLLCDPEFGFPSSEFPDDVTTATVATSGIAGTGQAEGEQQQDPTQSIAPPLIISRPAANQDGSNVEANTESVDATGTGLYEKLYRRGGHKDARGLDDATCSKGRKSKGFETRYIVVTTQGIIKVQDDCIRVTATQRCLGSSGFWMLKEDTEEERKKIRYSDVTPRDKRTAFYVLTTERYGAHLVVIIAGNIYNSSVCDGINAALSNLYNVGSEDEAGPSTSKSPATPKQQPPLKLVERFSWAPFRGNNAQKGDIKLNTKRSEALFTAKQLVIADSITTGGSSTGTGTSNDRSQAVRNESEDLQARDLGTAFATMGVSGNNRSENIERQQEQQAAPAQQGDGDAAPSVPEAASIPAADEDHVQQVQQQQQNGGLDVIDLTGSLATTEVAEQLENGNGDDEHTS
ncbi:hypothetical protein Ndes2526B_g02492 [Nannochloris sp. 'desiccata']